MCQTNWGQCVCSFSKKQGLFIFAHHINIVWVTNVALNWKGYETSKHNMIGIYSCDHKMWRTIVARKPQYIFIITIRINRYGEIQINRN